MIRIFLLLGLCRLSSAVGYKVAKTVADPKLGDLVNLQCSVAGIDPNSTDSVIVWYQEREVHEALLGRVDNLMPVGRIAAACRTSLNANGNLESVFMVNPDSVLPFPPLIQSRICDADTFNLLIRFTGVQHIGEWWCHYTSLQSSNPSVKILGELVEPVDRKGLMEIRQSDGKLSLQVGLPSEALPEGEVAGLANFPLTLDCPVNTSALSDPVTFTWQRILDKNKGKVVIRSTEMKVLYNGSLAIDKLKMDDAAEYYCTAKSGSNSIEEKLLLNVHALPEYNLFVDTTEYVGIFVRERNDDLLTAVTYAQKQGAAEAEVVDSYTFDLRGGENVRTFRYPLSFTRAYHNGKFFVKFFSYLPGIQPFPVVRTSLDYLIKVSFPVSKVSLSPSRGLKHVRAVEGQGVQVKCMAEGGGDPTETLYFYQRLHDGGQKTLGANGLGVQWLTQEQPTKIIESISLQTFTRDDNGTSLECLADGDNGTKQISSLVLEVFWLPEVFNFTMTPDRAVVPAGTDVSLECYTIGGNPENVTIIVKYGDRIIDTPDGLVRYFDISDAESGRYSCIMESAAGRLVRELVLAVQKEPFTVKESIGPLILVILITVMIVGAIAAFFLFFMLRGDPDKRKRKRKEKLPREPRFRPPKKEITSKKQKSKKQGATLQPDIFTDITPIPVDHTDDQEPNHVTAADEPAVQEDMIEDDDVELEMEPNSPFNGSQQVTVDINGTIDEDKFRDRLRLQYVDDESEAESTNL